MYSTVCILIRRVIYVSYCVYTDQKGYICTVLCVY